MTTLLKDKALFPFIAPPNGGKGTQTQRLSNQYDLPTFDMGATFRDILKNGSDPELKQELESYMSQGQLVPIETVVKVFTKGFEALAAKYPFAKGFILDGFPRSVDQANELERLCTQWEAKIAKVIYLNVQDSVVERRAVGRRFCSKDARHVFNILENNLRPQKQKLNTDGTNYVDEHGNDVWFCDHDGAELVIRKDDEQATVKKRLVEYHSETDPIVDKFRKSGELVEIDGQQNPDKVTQAVEAAVKPVLGLAATTP